MSDPDARYAELAMRAVDGLASTAEQAELERLVRERPELAEELADFFALKARTDGMRDRILASAARTPARPRGAERRRLELGFGAIGLGLAVLVVGGVGLALLEPELPWPLRAGLALLAGGVAVLLHFVWPRRDAGPDPYEEIDR
jgi:ferric-dicitrate binding protein FerR (iron transport regulator)